jgi:hypothetical protein
MRLEHTHVYVNSDDEQVKMLPKLAFLRPLNTYKCYFILLELYRLREAGYLSQYSD